MYVLFFVFKQKAAYVMRISDWSSDVCSSDLADMVLFVFREDYYVAAREPKRLIEGDDVKIHAQHEEWAAEMERVFGLAEVIVAKSRHGSTGKVRLHFEAKTTKIGRAHV